MNEGRGLIEGDFVGLLRRHFDEIPQNVVVLDLQVLDRRFVYVTALQAGDQTAAFVPEGAEFIQFR